MTVNLLDPDDHGASMPSAANGVLSSKGRTEVPGGATRFLDPTTTIDARPDDRLLTLADVWIRMCPYLSRKKRAEKTKAWFDRHKVERAAYMRKYRRKRRRARMGRRMTVSAVRRAA